MKFLTAVFLLLFCLTCVAETYQCDDMKYEMKGDTARAIYPEMTLDAGKVTMSCTYIHGVRLNPDKDTRSHEGPLFIYTGIYDSCSMGGILIFDPSRSRLVRMNSDTLESTVLKCKELDR